MFANITAILFDVGGTLRSSVKKDDASKIETVSQIVELLDADSSPEQFAEMLTTRARNYMRWARETLIELNERDLWTRWMLPDWPVDQVSAMALQLNSLWRTATGERIIFPETKKVILELFRRGYRLAIVSNTITSAEVPGALKEMEITGCFETVVLSSVVGMRKPGSAIMLEATRRMGVKPENCVYIGDRLNRDVEASREAGFAKVIIRRNEYFQVHQAKYADLVADYYIDDLTELLSLFPVKSEQEVQPRFKASLSTMWAVGNFPGLPDFFEAVRRMGFSHIELNHQINSSMLEGIDLSQYRFSSLHEPCPADIATDELKKRDWLISSTNEENRGMGVQAVMHSIDLAHKLQTQAIVIHCGAVPGDLAPEKELRKLFVAGKKDTDEYRQTKQILIDYRTDLIGPHLEAVKKSLLELLDYAASFRIFLGLENRYHYFDIPGLDELGELLSLAEPDRLGFVYDVGHAQTLDQLGFYAHEEWLHRYAARMIEVHLHDVIDVSDHQAPGLGEVDFDRIVPYLSEDVIRTFELQAFNTPEQVRAGLKFLVDHGCVEQLK